MSKTHKPFPWPSPLAAVLVAGAVLCGVQFWAPIPQEPPAPPLTMRDFVLRPHNASQASPTVAGPRLRRNSPVDHDSTVTESVEDSTPLQYYTVFSSSCSPQQHWESYVFFYHAMKVRQPGTVVRIASGCTTEEEQALRAFHDRFVRPMGDFRLHFTPSYARLQLAGGAPYKYMNKPYGLRHWFEHALGLRPNVTAPPDVADSILILMDPDMILLRPLRHDLAAERVLWVETDPATRVVRHGHPIAQQDGYLTNEWMRLPLNASLPRDAGDGPRHWNSGPPYLATVRDMYALTIGWTAWVHRVLDVYPKLFAEMYGLIFAGLELNLPFTFVRSLVVSDPSAGPAREGWPYIDDMPDKELCDAAPTGPLPIGLHYCKRYMLGKNFFSKYRLKKNIMDCEKPLIRPPPKDVYPRYNYSVNVPLASGTDRETYKEVQTPLSQKRARREAFMLCAMTDKVNEALEYYKERACNGTANLDKTYSVYDDPASTR